jgi:hypothetical protein
MEIQHGHGLSPWHEPEPPPDQKRERLLFAVRYVLPAVIFTAGLLELVLDSDSERGIDIGCMAMGAAIAVALLNFFFRMGVSGDEARDREEEARAYFDRHGRWPDEPRIRGGA